MLADAAASRPLEQEPGVKRAAADPAEVVADHPPDSRLGGGGVVEQPDQPFVVVAQALDVERRGDPLLVAEVVVDRADRGAGALPDVGDRRRRVAVLAERLERRLEDPARSCGRQLH